MTPKRFRLFGVDFSGSEMVRTPASDDATHRIRLSFSTALTAALMGMLLSLAFEVPFGWSLLATPFFAYLGWSAFWGLVASNRVATRGFGPGWGALFWSDMGGIAIPIQLLVMALGVAYGVLGGGLREFVLHRRVASHPDDAAAAADAG